MWVARVRKHCDYFGLREGDFIYKCNGGMVEIDGHEVIVDQNHPNREETIEELVRLAFVDSKRRR